MLQLNELSLDQRAQLDTFFAEKVFPVLTPLAFDPGRPFPHISNLSLNIAVAVRDPGGRAEHFARVKVPDSLPQLLPVAWCRARHRARFGFVWLEQLIIANLHHLFPGLEILRAHVFHLTRDAEVAIKELETDDLLETIEEAVWQRRFRDAVRLQVDARMPAAMIDLLAAKLELDAADIFRVQGPLDLSRLRHLSTLDRPDLKDKPFLPHTPAGFASKDDDVFDVIRQQDQLLHHPYESFQPVVEFLRKAARDPDVLAIKMTLYRLGRNSPIVEALLEAVENGKQVAVVVELKARFDEESNIEWARALEREGVHVVYGLLGLKVHSKVILVVRREGDVIRRYCHLATGNYNPATARLYTDLGLFTCDEEIGADATDLFNYLTGYSRKKTFRKLLVAPLNLRQRIEEMIQREIDIQRHGGRGRMILKMNALEDGPIIKLLYQASQAGVVDRSDRARRLLPSSAGARRQRKHSCSQRAGPVPGTQPHLLLPQQWRGGMLSGQRRSDAPQSEPPRRSSFPRQPPGHDQADPRRNPALLPARRNRRSPHVQGRLLFAQIAPRGRRLPSLVPEPTRIPPYVSPTLRCAKLNKSR